MEPDLRRAVDEVLEPAWQAERRRAWRDRLGRMALFLLALGALGLVVQGVFGVVVPWVFYAFMGGLALVCSGRGPSAMGGGEDGGLNGRPSTGCYPRVPLE